MPNIAIICSIERLFGPYGQLSKAAYFGMNLSAAIVGTQADVTAANKTFTVPWTWNLTGLKAWVGTSADPNQGQEVAVTLVPHDPIQRPDLITNALLNEPMQGPGAWLFHEAPESAASFDAKSWHSLLAHASTYPAPVPQSLNLALHFSIANLPAAGNLFVAPILDAGGAGNPITVIQAPSMPAAGQPTITIVQAAAPGKIGFAKWNYVAPPAGQLPIAGYVNQIDLAEQPAKGDFIDFGNLWIKGVQQTEDWRAQLESRVAEAFDLSRAILDFAKSASLAPAAIADPFFASLHDRANAGLFFAPDGSSLARYLVDQCQAAIGDSSPSLPFVQALDTYEAALTLQDWEALLSQTIPEGPSIKIATIVALEAWWGLLADDGVLARLIYAQWQSAVKAAPQPVQDFWNKISGTLQNQVLPSIQLRKRYALATIGNLSNTAPDAAHGLWQLIATGANGIKANLTDYLVRYAKGRFGGGDASDQKRYEFFFPQKVAPIPADPTGFLTKFAGDFFQNVIQPPGSSDSQQPGQAAPMSTPAPTGITLQLDTITAVDDAADFQRKMTGAGVLMRKKGGTWRCLNVAAPYTRTVDSATGTATDAAIFPKGSVVPYRLDYHNGVRQAFVTYKNHPLVAESPAAPLAGDLQLKDDNSSAPSASLLVYKVDFTADAANPQVSNPWAILPGLFYSDDDRAYEFLPFAMTNSGAIPAELAVPESKGAQGNITPAIPSRIRDDPQTFSPANLAPIEAGYKRRVQVGALRFRDDKGQVLTEKSKLLPLPANVVPKFHDVAPQGETQPLLFLYQGGPSGSDSFNFSVRPPATDINTWDQWVGPGNREQRIRAWADYHANSPQAPVANPVVLDTGRVTFDDPAVTGLQATLSQIWPRNGTNISLPTVPFDKTGSLYQAPAIPVNCSIGAASIKPPSAAGGAITVQVPANEVWQLSIVPLIAGAAKFEEGVLGIANDGPLAPAAFQAVIEVASPALPAAADIWGSLILPSDNTGASSFSVALKPNLSDPESPWANVRTVELLRQIWRWSGRPFSSFGNYPQNQLDPQPGGKETDAMLWEAEAFGDRDDSDHISISQQVNFASPAQGTEPPVLYTEDLSSDLRTHYYRFALRVTSRYSGILPAPQQTSQVPLVTSEGKGFTIWRRYWINNRCADPLPKPQIKIILPLTSAEDSSDSVPGLLCVLNEPWYNIGGLSEELQAEIAPTDVQGPAPAPPTPLEFGPDPILTGDASVITPDKALELNGPFGYTFDTGTAAPLIVASSFIVRPPAAPRDKSLAWYFAKLRFRRAVGDLQSEPTDPQWVQFVPDFTRFQSSTGMISVSDLSVQRLSDSSFQFLKGGAVAELQAASPFEILVVVTQKVMDALGRQGQERFVGIAKHDIAAKAYTVVDKLPATFTVRLLEVQRRGQAGTDLFSDLFPEPENEADAAARVVRISPLVDSVCGT